MELDGNSFKIDTDIPLMIFLFHALKEYKYVLVRFFHIHSCLFPLNKKAACRFVNKQFYLYLIYSKRKFAPNIN